MCSFFKLKGVAAIDYIAGLQAVRDYNLKPYPVFTDAVRNKLADYLEEGGRLLLSGSFVGSDNQTKANQNFIENVLKYKYDGSARNDSTDYVNGLNRQFLIYRQPNAQHYASIAPDALVPTSNKAFTAFVYGGGQSAGVAYRGKNYRTLCMGFPFECIRDAKVRAEAMEAILKFLCSKE